MALRRGRCRLQSSLVRNNHKVRRRKDNNRSSHKDNQAVVRLRSLGRIPPGPQPAPMQFLQPEAIHL